MDRSIIRKPRLATGSAEMQMDYETACQKFSWAAERARSASLPGGAVNIGFEACDRQVAAGRGDVVALQCLSGSAMAEISYRTLSERSARMASALGAIGVARGERVFTLLGRVPELYVSALGVWKHGAVFCPLFSAFGPEPIAARLLIAEPAALITTVRLYERKLEALLERLPFLRHVVLIDVAGTGLPVKRPSGPELHSFDDLLSSNEPADVVASTDPDDLATLHFTSGTTGVPKAAMHVHEAVIAHRATAEAALDLRPDDIYWCTADPGWVTGTSYGIIGPLAVGCTLIVDQNEFDVERWYRTLSEQRVSVWYTAPTAIRMLMKDGRNVLQDFDLSALRFIASVGEPLNPEAVLWGRDVLGRPIHDNWWQTETGGIMIANLASMDIRPGSMGRPLPGIEAAVLEATDQGGVERIQDPTRQGELAIKAGWPSMFRGYLGQDERYRRCFRDGWYLSGDIVRRDADGYYWFVGRSDDVIKTAGHLIGPFEVESALMSHPAVAEAAAIGMPDPTAMEVVKAFVSLKPGFEASAGLNRELLAHARKQLGPAVAPREIAFRDELPRTRSGKIMRRLLKCRELGLPEGDISTLEAGQ